MGWNEVGTGLWTRIYNFNTNPITTLAIDLGGGGLGILSPGTDLTPADFDALDRIGTVKALISPGAFHHMGFPAWSARYPEAGIYGPHSAIAHVAKQHKSLKPMLHLDALAPMLPAGVSIEEMPGMKHPDVLAIIRRDDAITWFTNECLTNNSSLPKNPIFSLLFRLSGSGPGLNVNSLALKFIGGKKPIVRDYLLRKLESDPPTRFVPCHGDVIDDPKLAARMREVIERRLS